MSRTIAFAVRLVLLGVVFNGGTTRADHAPFAVRVVDYSPAPGQFVNNPAFNDPTRALGPPSGGGTLAPNNVSVVTLGGFGGSITLAFDHRVEDHPLNPYGLDAIVFGNAFWTGVDGQTHHAECAVIEIALDANGNQLADDRWYLIPGSHLDPSDLAWHQKTWDDDTTDATFPPAAASWLPSGSAGTWTTEGFTLPAAVFGRFSVRNPLYPLQAEGVFGYADYAPTLVLGDLDANNAVDDHAMTPELHYTVPDDPFTVGIDAYSGGGDAFDIAWAVDPETGAPANLSGFDFIRITNPTDVVFGLLGEISPEIDAVADVAPDLTGDADRDHDIDLADVAVLQRCMDSAVGVANLCDRLALRDGFFIDRATALVVIARMTGPGGD